MYKRQSHDNEDDVENTTHRLNLEAESLRNKAMIHVLKSGSSIDKNGEKVYEGEYKDNMKHGQGTYYYADDEKYIGEWRNGKFEGMGTFTFFDGSNYHGQWKKGAIPDKWDGRTGERIVVELERLLEANA